MVKIFIDAGHGGTDSGANGNGLSEKDITLQIANRVRDMLQNEYQNVSIKMSRTGDQTLSLKQRTDMANAWGADFFLSIHINSGGGVALATRISFMTSFPTALRQRNCEMSSMKRLPNSLG